MAALCLQCLSYRLVLAHTLPVYHKEFLNILIYRPFWSGVQTFPDSLRLKHTSKLQKIVKGTAEGGFSREKVLWKLDFPEKIHMLFSSALVGGGSFYGVEVIPSIYSRKSN